LNSKEGCNDILDQFHDLHTFTSYRNCQLLALILDIAIFFHIIFMYSVSPHKFVDNNVFWEYIVTVMTTAGRREATPPGKSTLSLWEGRRLRITQAQRENDKWYATESEWGDTRWFPLRSTDWTDRVIIPCIRGNWKKSCDHYDSPKTHHYWDFCGKRKWMMFLILVWFDLIVQVELSHRMKSESHHPFVPIQYSQTVLQRRCFCPWYHSRRRLYIF
jgi:hypothetical protein